MGRYTEEGEKGLAGLPCRRKSFAQLKAAGSPLAQRILRKLSPKPLYGQELAELLGVHEQKVYYHLRRLERAGLIAVERREEVSGASAKYYRLAAPAFAVLLEEPRPGTRLNTLGPEEKGFLEPFIADGRQEFLIVVGSPDPHGPEMARARDGSYAIDLALFLGGFLAGRATPVVKLDTEFAEEDWRRNLIVIGGPIVNTVAARINRRMAVRFSEDGKAIESRPSGERYESDQIGLIAKGENPRAPGKRVLFIAGRRQAGTKAAILAFLRRFDELIAGNSHDQGIMARVVEGKDLDSDGLVDDLHFRE